MDTTIQYPNLAGDLETVEQMLKPAFERADTVALRHQRLFRVAELTVIFGAVVAVTLGAIAAAGSPSPEKTGGALNVWAVAEAAVTFALGSLIFMVNQFGWHRKWLQYRTVAETLRGEQFLFLGRIGVYAEAEDPKHALEMRVVEIECQGVMTSE